MSIFNGLHDPKNTKQCAMKSDDSKPGKLAQTTLQRGRDIGIIVSSRLLLVCILMCRILRY